MTSSERALVAGIDIGGTKCAVAIGDGTSEALLASNRFSSDVDKGPQAMIRRMTEEVRKLLAKTPGKLVGIGVACGGPIDRQSGIVLSPPNLPGWDRVSLTARLAANLSAPAWLENDANMGALGELRHGAGKGVPNFMYVTLSTGIGAGLVLNGAVHYGAGDSAGELGHVTVLPNGPRCPCGNSGCLEMVASGAGLARTARDVIKVEPNSALRLIESAGTSAVTAKDIAEAARTGDALSKRLWREAMGYLSTALGNVVCVLAPSKVILGGGMAQAGDLLLDAVREGIRQRVRLVPSDQYDIVLATLGQDSVLRGTLALAVQAVAEKRPIAPLVRRPTRTTGDLKRR